MNKEELIAAIAQKVGGNQKLAQAFLEAFILTIQENIANGESVYIPELGTFEPNRINK